MTPTTDGADAGLAPGIDRPIRTVDYHTAGEPFRIVTGGVPELEGRSVLERRRWALEHLDDVRRLLVNEPRGHADMYGAFVTPPDGLIVSGVKLCGGEEHVDRICRKAACS